MSTNLFFAVQIGSLLMEPGAKLFQPMGGLAGVPTEEMARRDFEIFTKTGPHWNAYHIVFHWRNL